MFKHFLVLFYFCIFSIISNAQNFCGVSGKIINNSSHEPIIAASVYISDLNFATVTDIAGTFKVQIPRQKLISLEISYIGFATKTIQLQCEQDTILQILLTPQNINLEKVIINKKQKNSSIISVDMDNASLSSADLKKIPALMGEADVVRSLTTSGAIRQQEGAQGMNVRGGSQEQNLVLLDNAKIYNSSHILGFFSVFPSDIINDAQLYKSTIPPQYGGRLSSVLDVTTESAICDSVEAFVSLGLISSRAFIKMPLNSKSGLLFSGRISYLNFIIMPIIEDLLDVSDVTNNFNFKDATLRYDSRINQKHLISFSSYFGGDNFLYKNHKSELLNEINWGNFANSLHWKYLENDFINTTIVTYSNYFFNLFVDQKYYKVRIDTEVDNVTLSWRQKRINSANKLQFGGSFDYSQYNVGELNAEVDSVVINKAYPKEESIEAAFFVEASKKMSDRFLLEGVFRIMPFVSFTKGYTNLYSNIGYEPRIHAMYLVSKSSSYKLAFMRSEQNVHMVSLLSSALPADIWISAKKETPKSHAYTSSIGYFRNFAENAYETSVSFYYKQMNDLIENTGSYISVTSQDSVSSYAIGKGFAAGLEFSVKKNSGKLTGAVSYNFSRSLRKFTDINTNAWYPALYDKPNDINVSMHYKLSKNWSASAVWVFASGKVYTEPIAQYIVQKNIVFEYGAINSKRMSEYHRLDVSLEYALKKGRFADVFFQASLYNAYNRSNPYYVFNDVDVNVEHFSVSNTKEIVSLFTIMPSVSINIDFK